MAFFDNPIPLEDFADILPIAASSEFGLVDSRVGVTLRSGEVITADHHDRYWAGRIDLGTMRAADADFIRHRLDLLTRAGAAFEMSKPLYRGFSSDLGELAGYVPMLRNVLDESIRVRVGGLPSGYFVRRGDVFSLTYPDGGRVFHEITQGGAAVLEAPPGEFYTGWLVVSPGMRPGFLEGAPIELARPSMLAKVVPGSVQYGTRTGRNVSGVGFSFRQTLGAVT